MSRHLAFALAIGALVASGCGGADDAERAPVVASAEPTSAMAEADATSAASALVQIAQVPEVDRRLAFVDLRRAQALRPLGTDRVLARVLGMRTPRDADTAVRVGNAIVLKRAGAEPVIKNADARLRKALSGTAPAVNAIEDDTVSAVQACLGDAIVETIVGGAVLGPQSGVGAALRSKPSGGGFDVVLCAAPIRVRAVHATEHRIAHAYPRAQGGEFEYGERHMLAFTVDAKTVSRRELLELLSGGPALVRLMGPRG